MKPQAHIRILLMAGLITFSQCGFSQIELVQNGGFEFYTSVPNEHNQLNLATGWFDPAVGQSEYRATNNQTMLLINGQDPLIIDNPFSR